MVVGRSDSSSATVAPSRNVNTTCRSMKSPSDFHTVVSVVVAHHVVS